MGARASGVSGVGTLKIGSFVAWNAFRPKLLGFGDREALQVEFGDHLWLLMESSKVIVCWRFRRRQR
jgi:hypothetical protein